MTAKFRFRTRHAKYAAAALGAAVVGVAGVSTASAATTAASVDMEQVVVQSQVEPWLNADTDLPGDASVTAVQQALDAKGYDTPADGWWGDGTRSDYSAWQRSLGYSGDAANGIPGPSSLTSLGEGRFDLVNKVSVGSRTTYSGKPVNQRTRDMLAAADAKFSWGITVTQGSYQGCSDASACTHAGGGAVDISVSGVSTTNRWVMVKALRQVGFAAWLRTPDQGFAYHIHAVAVGDTDAHIQAADQVGDYYRGRNGLASHAADNTPSEYRVPFTWWEKSKRG